ncbi:MAG: DRTGG domain-containing protein [Oscillospiraceae bacterium]
MTIREIIGILDAEVLTPAPDLDRDIHSACGSDMMSDVLAFVKDQSLLLTGLTNPQAVRTASMMDICCVMFVRGKRPDAAVTKLASDMHITLLATRYTMYDACGRLYDAGLRG